MIRLPFILGGLAVYLVANYVARRRDPTRLTLSDGRRVKLLSSVAILSESSCRALNFEYLSGLVRPSAADIRDEALSFLHTAADRPEYHRCRDATVTVRLIGEDPAASPHSSRILAFRRDDADADWYPIDRAESAAGELGQR